MDDNAQNVKNKFSQLVEYIKGGHYFEYIMALDTFPNIDFQNQDGETLLHICVEENSYRFLLSTLTHSANVNIKTSKGLTPLMFAIWKGFMPLAAALLKAGANPNEKDNLNRTPLFFAVRRGDIHAINLLLIYKADPNIEYENKSLLWYAAITGYPESIRLLIDYGANTTLGTPPPIIACLKNGNRECLAALLLDHEDDVLFSSDEKPIILHALEMETNLLPVIANLVQKATERKRIENGSVPVPPFPPKNLSKRQKKKLQTALDLNDNLVSIDSVLNTLKKLKPLWKETTVEQSVSIEDY